MEKMLIIFLLVFANMGLVHAQSAPPKNADVILCSAIVNGDVRGVIAAIEKGSDPNGICTSTARQKRTAFDVALTSNNKASEEIATYLISKGASAAAQNTMTGRQWYSNFDSATSHSLIATQAFLRAGVNPETVDAKIFLNTPLLSALTSQLNENTKLQITDLLIQYGESPSDQQVSQLTFLLLSGFDDAFVLSRVRQWNFKKDFFTAGEYLFFAATARRGIPVLDAMVRAGANVRDPVGNGSSALDDYFWDDGQLRKPSDIQVVDWLIKQGAPADSLSLSIAFKEGNLAVCGLLLKNGANPNNSSALISNDVYNAKTSAAGAALLFRYGAIVDHISSASGLSPLSVAAELNHLEMAKIYVSHGATINLKNSDGTTPLCRAKLFGAANVETFLLSKGAVIGSCPLK